MKQYFQILQKIATNIIQNEEWTWASASVYEQNILWQSCLSQWVEPGHQLVCSIMRLQKSYTFMVASTTWTFNIMLLCCHGDVGCCRTSLGCHPISIIFISHMFHWVFACHGFRCSDMIDYSTSQFALFMLISTPK